MTASSSPTTILRTSASALLVVLSCTWSIMAVPAPQGTTPPVISGDGPPAPSVSFSAPSGSWSAPTASVTVGGNTFRPPSLNGQGRQAQINSATDFCLYMPPDPSTQNIVDAEALAVAYCFNPFNDTRPFPDGFITRSHFRQTPDYVQVSGTFDPTRMNLGVFDCGGEYDNHGAEGLGNPVGAHIDGGDNWMEFIGSCDIPDTPTFCIRSCHGSNSLPYCNNRYDLMGCLWVMPADYDTDPAFTNCQADSDLPVGVYNESYTFSQGQSVTPTAITAPSSSQCSQTSSPPGQGVTYFWEDAVTGMSNNPSQTGSSSSPTGSNGSGSSSAMVERSTSNLLPVLAILACLACGMLVLT